MSIRARTRTVVHVHLKSQSSAVSYTDVINTYQKGDLFCVMRRDRSVHKFPLENIFRVVEEKP